MHRAPLSTPPEPMTRPPFASGFEAIRGVARPDGIPRESDRSAKSMAGRTAHLCEIVAVAQPASPTE